MSSFSVNVVRIDSIEPIPGADAIELAKIADYRSVVRKGDFKAGDLAIYIPEASVVPEWLLKDMNLEGKLAGANKNRVKAIKLRGVLSQGLLYKVKSVEKNYLTESWYKENMVEVPSMPHDGNQGGAFFVLGDDVKECMGIKKYEPQIPTSMAGEVCNIGTENTVNYDIENLKKYPYIFTEGEEVSVTEKIHGTFCGIGYVKGLNHPDLFDDGNLFVFSKGLGAQGLVFKNNDNNQNNLYVKTLKTLMQHDGFNRILSKVKTTENTEEDFTEFFMLGEIFGPVQDLTYGLTEPKFRVFDIRANKKNYWNTSMVQSVCKIFGIPYVDVLYQGPYSKQKMDELATGKTITGNGSTILEGVVIRPMHERRNDDIGRVILKHISEQYLLRKGNATEFN